ncbi:hypothetical protein WA026_019590 [Henosepilachna vigintioctopunctata]|uniref:Uncharacterized protein n=1 Tax=Henosepilachna vigintioctopunctata TaxID=420089 RepID=A0AAW1TYK6_9CUCU
MMDELDNPKEKIIRAPSLKRGKTEERITDRVITPQKRIVSPLTLKSPKPKAKSLQRIDKCKEKLTKVQSHKNIRTFESAEGKLQTVRAKSYKKLHNPLRKVGITSFALCLFFLLEIYSSLHANIGIDKYTDLFLENTNTSSK